MLPSTNQSRYRPPHPPSNLPLIKRFSCKSVCETCFPQRSRSVCPAKSCCFECVSRGELSRSREPMQGERPDLAGLSLLSSPILMGQKRRKPSKALQKTQSPNQFSTLAGQRAWRAERLSLRRNYTCPNPSGRCSGFQRV